MNNKKKFILASSVMCMAAVGALGALALSSGNESKAVNPVKADEQVYTLTIDCTQVILNGDPFGVETDRGNEVFFSFNGFSKVSGGLSFDDKSTIVNVSPFQKLKKIKIDGTHSNSYYQAASAQIPEDAIAMSHKDYGKDESLDDGGSYFRIGFYSNDSGVISQIVVTYACA